MSTVYARRVTLSVETFTDKTIFLRGDFRFSNIQRLSCVRGSRKSYQSYGLITRCRESKSLRCKWRKQGITVRRDSAVKLIDGLAGESPASAGYPVGTVVISGDGAGDQTVGSPDVDVLDGWTQVWSARQEGKHNNRS
jgi:hypothetical protein